MTKLRITTTLLAVVLVVGGGLGAYSMTAAEGVEEQANTIEVAVNETFEITLDSNPTTGYAWQARYEEGSLELVDRTFAPSSDLIGAGGIETLTFRALKTGGTTLTLVYERAWEEEPIDTVVYQINVAR
jgi:inhibitor of cysteine peptidase